MKKIIYISGKKYKNKVKECIALDKIVYEDKYVGNEEFYLKSFEVREDNFTFAIDTETGSLAGYVLCTPMDKTVYDHMRSGQYIDTEFIKLNDIKDISSNRDNYIYIYSLVVSPDFQGLGVGKGLLSKFFDDIDALCEDYDIKAVLADTINPKIYNYMSKNGFCPVRNTSHDSMLIEKTISNADKKVIAM